MNTLFVFRALFVATVAALLAVTGPLGLAPAFGAAVGAFLAVLLVTIESQLRRQPFPRLAGACLGGFLGVSVALLATMTLEHGQTPPGILPALSATLLVTLAAGGVSLGAAHGERLKFGSASVDAGAGIPNKILDTSVIIDGRVADLVETGFLDGTLLIPQFVLQELQFVADSADTLKRNRGRRGLDMLQRLQQLPGRVIRIIDEDFPQIREVDMKLIELAKRRGCKVVTNDFNLNKVASLHGVEVLNINELANALRPVVLPGEVMKVFILKEGKEFNQGVAYLDDGTMVVVDNARKQISKTIEISVTSVLQTTAGKMIFGKFDERVHVAEKPAERAASR